MPNKWIEGCKPDSIEVRYIAVADYFELEWEISPPESDPSFWYPIVAEYLDEAHDLMIAEAGKWFAIRLEAYPHLMSAE